MAGPANVPRPHGRQEPPTDRAAAAAFFSDAAARTPLVAATIEPGLRVLLDTSMPGTARMVFAKGRIREAGAMMRAARRLRSVEGRRGGLFFDTRAGVGLACLAALTVAGYEHALAAEPDPAQFRLLRMNAIENRLEARISPVNRAVGEASGSQSYVPTPDGWAFLPAPPDAPGGIRVPVGTVSEAAASAGVTLDRVALAWVDARAAPVEAAAVAGALVAADVPTVVAAASACDDAQAAAALRRLDDAAIGFGASITPVGSLAGTVDRRHDSPLEDLAEQNLPAALWLLIAHQSRKR